MNNRQIRFFNIAKEISKLSDFKRAHIGAVVVEKNRIISTGHNASKTSTTQYKYNWYRSHGDEAFKNCIHRVHAEIAALSPIMNKKDINWSHVSIYVYRELSDGTRTCARPCEACSALIKKLGIKTVYYTDWDGNYIKEKYL